MKKLILIVIILILSYWAVKSLFIPGFFPIHDDTQVSRIYEMSESLRDGMFPVRWVSDLGYGYGYPIFNFYAPLSYYFGGALVLLGSDPLIATKAAFALGILLAGLFMFLLGKTLWGNFGGAISAIFYVYAPYSALNIYVRGDLSEIWGYAFVPLFFYGIVNVYKNLEIKYMPVSALGLAAIILSHNLTAYMTAIFFVPTVIFLAFLSEQKIKFLVLSVGSFVLGALLASFYFIPALLEMQYTNVFSQIGGGADFRDHFVCLTQLWESNWGFGGSALGCMVDGMSYRIGKLHLIAAIVPLFVLFLKNKRAKKRVIAFLGLLFLISVFLMLSVSRFVWEITPLMDFLQYPWRFLVFASFSSSLLAGGSILVVKLLSVKIIKIAQIWYLVLILVFTVFIYAKLFVPQTILPKMSADYTEESVLNYKISEISDEYLPANFDKPESIDDIPRDVLVIAEGEGSIDILSVRVPEVNARVNMDNESIIHANIAYFPAWEVNINGRDTEINVKNDGFDFSLPPGESEVSIVFSQTPVEKIANILSLLALILLIGTILKAKGVR